MMSRWWIKLLGLELRYSTTACSKSLAMSLGDSPRFPRNAFTKLLKSSYKLGTAQLT